ncbi:PhzF family phenazine biosynthesis protein [Roseovarius ramblicola]|uniref:PhzF family phenazine biosynthesis protein n=1 Tax=Roseovarius ramblicola TaxID=2022336 RepID=A0ABV5HX11_9RHOB
MAGHDDPDWADTGVTRAQVLEALNLDETALIAGVAPTVVDTGNRFMLVGLGAVDALRAVGPDMAAIEDISERLDLIGFYVFAPLDGDAVATTRMFAPRYGIDEEAATGMAAGPLGCLLHDRLGAKKDRILIEQGALMTPPSPSLLDVRLTRSAREIAGLMVGGYGRVIKEKKIQY